MSKASDAKLAVVKRKLAEKCERLAKISGSKPKRKTLSNSAKKYRRQVDDLQARSG